MSSQMADVEAPRGGFNIYDPKLRGFVYQVLLVPFWPSWS